MTLSDRLAARLVLDPESGCLLWTGCVNRQGYGEIRDGRKVKKVHRVAWELANGPIPDGLTIDHVKARGCRHRNCANVAHLEAVTLRENIMRGDTIAAARVAQTECVNGHPFDTANTLVLPNGNRKCKTCIRRRGRDYMRRRRAA